MLKKKILCLILVLCAALVLTACGQQQAAYPNQPRQDTGSAVQQQAPVQEQVVAQATGKVWECHVEAHRAEEMAAQMQVANVRYAADGHAVVRVVADESPMGGATPVEPTLEDLYLYVFRDQVER